MMLHSRWLRKLDVFSTTDFWKISRENAYKTKTGGALTIIFIGLILLILSMRLKSRGNGELMTFKSKTQYDTESLTLNTSTEAKDKFMLGVAVYRSSHFYNNNDFHVELRTTSLNRNDSRIPIYIMEQTSYRLEPCTPDHWNLTPQIKKVFQKDWQIKKDIFMCLPQNVPIKLEGQMKSPNFSFAEIVINRCDQRSQQLFNQICNEDTELDYYLRNQSLTVEVIYYNSNINPDELIYKKEYMETLMPFYISQQLFTEVFLQFSKYDVRTDRDYFNSNNPVRETGAYLRVQENFRNGAQIDTFQPLLKIILVRSKDTLVVDRIDYKILDIISYIGGLTASLFAICQALCSKYSSFSFEIQVSHNMYENQKEKEDPRQEINEGNPDNPQAKIKKKEIFSVNYFSFLKTKFWCFCKNQKMEKYQKQLSKQMDIQIIIQKISFFERAISILIKNRSIKLEEIDQNADKILQAKQFRKLLYKLYPKHEECVNLAIIQQNKGSTQTQSDRPAASSSNLHYQGPLEIVLNNHEPDPNLQNFRKYQIENNIISQGISQGFQNYLQINNFANKKQISENNTEGVIQNQKNPYAINYFQHMVNENESRQDKQMIDNRLRNIKRLKRQEQEQISRKRGLEGNRND